MIKDAGAGFSKHRGIKLSAALCFYAIFSLGPMMLVMIYISSLFLGRQAIEGSIYSQIGSVIGKDAALQIYNMIQNASDRSNSFLAVVGFATLFFASTAVFAEMHDSINLIWNLKVKSGHGFKQMVKYRFVAFSIIMGLGLILFIFLVINGILEGFKGNIRDVFPDAAVGILYTMNFLLTLLVVTLLFAFIYKILPDAVIQWKDVAGGALFAAVLFMLGKFLFTYYISRSNLGSTYGSAGSLVILLLWVFYSSLVFYFGAEFAKAYAMKFGKEILPKHFAVMVKVVRVESKERSVQENEKNEGY